MNFKKIESAILFVLLSTTLCFSQRVNQPMTNQDVTEMVASGFSDGVIIDKIHSADATSFDTSIEGLKSLQTAKVSDTVVRAMINPHPAMAIAKENTDFNDPAAHHAPGIYMYAKTENGMKMTLLEPTVYQGAVGGGAGFLLTLGMAKAKVKAIVRGAHAAIVSDNNNPVFYFYFDEEKSGFGYGAWGTPTSPNEFTLLKFEQKRDSRETVVASANAFGASVGADKKASNGFSFTKVRSGVYKVTPNTPLTVGEYCFLAPSSGERYGEYGRVAEASRLFDFAVLPATSMPVAAPTQTSAAVMQ